MTALGVVTVRRTYRRCGVGRDAGFPADGRLQLGWFLTERARRLACLFGVEESFTRAARLLNESVGWSISADKLRLLTHAEAAQLQRGRPERLSTAGHFAAASGDWELQIDAGKVNTPEGWRDVKVATFDRRDRAKPADSTGYEQRDLPAPSIRSVVAAIEPAEAFGDRCQVESMRLRRPTEEPLSLLGDGAEWIWKLGDRRFAGAEQVLDIDHAAEYLATLAQAGFGADGESASAWLDRARRALLGDGWAGVCELMACETATVADPQAFQAAYPAVANYLAGHQSRLSYAVRLNRGQSIGSGLIEGTIKQYVTRRMKRSGARWRPDHVGPFIELASAANGPEWADYWKTATNRPN